MNLPCKLKHNKQIVEVILGKHLRANEMLLCQECLLSIRDIKTIDISAL